jgi:hypothetical protein
VAPTAGLPKPPAYEVVKPRPPAPLPAPLLACLPEDALTEPGCGDKSYFRIVVKTKKKKSSGNQENARDEASARSEHKPVQPASQLAAGRFLFARGMR